MTRIAEISFEPIGGRCRMMRGQRTGLCRAAAESIELPTRWPDSPADASPLEQPILLGSTYIGLRTRFIDDFIDAGEASAQVVLLGAGLDTRAFRLRWAAGTVVFELDDRMTLDYKQAVLDGEHAEPRATRYAVAADLGEPWADILLDGGFDRERPTTWVVEGLFPYLSAEGQKTALTTIAELSVPGSKAVIERSVALPSTPDLEEKLRAFSAQTGVPMTDLLARANPPDPIAILEGHGWQALAHSVADLSSRYDRAIELSPREETDAPIDATAGPDDASSRGGFVTAAL